MTQQLEHMYLAHEIISIFFGANEALILCARFVVKNYYDLSEDAHLNFCLFAEACLEYNRPPSRSWDSDIFEGIFRPWETQL